jgi:hypothetical protein
MTDSIPPDILTKVELILVHSDPERMYLFPDQQTIGSGQTVSFKSGRNVVEDRRYKLVNPQVDLLRKLYAATPPDQQSFVIDAIAKAADEKSAAVAAHALVELRAVERLKHWGRFGEVTVNVLEAIGEKLVAEHWKFTEDDIASIASLYGTVEGKADAVMQQQKEPGQAWRPAGEWLWAKRANQVVLPTLGRILNSVQYVRLKNQLNELKNPAIDTDRQELLSRLERIGFDPKLPQALNQIERMGISATTAFDFKSAMDMLRTFFEEFVENAAKLVEKKTNVPVPNDPKQSHFGPFKDYLRKVDVIGVEEEELLGKLYRFLSNTGSHVLGSAPEQFHVARTTVIEWCMMIAGRVQAKLKT